jgi:hypothetical protein
MSVRMRRSGVRRKNDAATNDEPAQQTGARRAAALTGTGTYRAPVVTLRRQSAQNQYPGL